MAKQPKHLDKYVALLNKEMSEVDPLQQVVLKEHLIIESALDNIISLIFFHPEHIFKADSASARRSILPGRTEEQEHSVESDPISQRGQE